MKSAFFIASCVFLLTGVFTVSCNKENTSPTPDQKDSLLNTLPKQVIVDITYLGTEKMNFTTSFKYDTLNRKVEVFQDNPATEGLFDQLIITSFLIRTDIL